MINYKGAIIQKLEQIIEDNPTLSFGEILLYITHHTTLGKEFHKATDSELYSSIENFAKNGVESDEALSQEEFNEWVNNK